MDQISDVAKQIRNHTTAGAATTAPAPATWACKPGCQICGGYGLIHQDIQDIFDPQFGKVKICPNRDPFSMYGKLSGLVEEEYSLNWGKIIDHENVMQAVNAVKECLEWGYGWVYLWGGYGLAKSVIQRITVAESIRAYKPAAYCRMVEIIDHLRGAYDTIRPNEESEHRLDYWSDISVLAVDEFDRVKETEYAINKRFVLMDRRYEHACREKTVTILSSNSDPRELEGYLADRIFDRRFKVIKLTGTSMRPMMGGN